MNVVISLFTKDYEYAIRHVIFLMQHALYSTGKSARKCGTGNGSWYKEVKFDWHTLNWKHPALSGCGPGKESILYDFPRDLPLTS